VSKRAIGKASKNNRLIAIFKYDDGGKTRIECRLRGTRIEARAYARHHGCRLIDIIDLVGAADTSDTKTYPKGRDILEALFVLDGDGDIEEMLSAIIETAYSRGVEHGARK